MSRTYIARETALGRRVVIKTLSPELAAGVSVERFKRAIQLVAALQHSRVVEVERFLAMTGNSELSSGADAS